ncbi:hypothetical protein GYMLUDRAFT_561324 [Collybiopsis luxurians FD-317 M1]|uniref:Uncharacterized protein n=1 Tax=Collybiopsis luxurians FD-317 M1 TaxID=944289 RepID=A0A0D0BE50_9AGAR|nr:hypothetical protein GYMLUDRAFT_561324 [Collybiopsis luxurians FD-317 M1]
MMTASQIRLPLYRGPPSFRSTSSGEVANGQTNSSADYTQSARKTWAVPKWLRLSGRGDQPAKAEVSGDTLNKPEIQKLLSAISVFDDSALTVLHGAASSAPIPWLGELARLAVGIWEAVQTNRANKRDLLSLAEYVLGTVLTVVTTCEEVVLHGKESADSGSQAGQDSNNSSKRPDEVVENDVNRENGQALGQLESSVRQLCSTLTEISDYARRNALRRFFTAGKVVEYRDKISAALDDYLFQANSIIAIDIQRLLSRIEAQRKILQAKQSNSLVPATVTHVAVAAVLQGNSSPEPSGAGSTGGVDLAPSFPASGSVQAAGSFRIGELAIVASEPRNVSGVPKSQLEPERDHRIENQPGISFENIAKENAVGESMIDVVSGGDVEEVQRDAEGEDRDAGVADNFLDPAGVTSESSGVVQVTWISGDQNITRVKDNSQRRNYGNIYNNHGITSTGVVPGPDLGRDMINTNSDIAEAEAGTGTPSLGYCRDFLNEGGEGRGREEYRWSSSNLSDPSQNNDHRDARLYMEYDFGATTDRNTVSNAFESHYGGDDTLSRDSGSHWHYRQRWQDNGAVFPPRQTYYDENGVPCAVPLGGGRRWRH